MSKTSNIILYGLLVTVMTGCLALNMKVILVDHNWIGILGVGICSWALSTDIVRLHKIIKGE